MFSPVHSVPCLSPPFRLFSILFPRLEVALKGIRGALYSGAKRGRKRSPANVSDGCRCRTIYIKRNLKIEANVVVSYEPYVTV